MRYILHSDLNNFYASVECLFNEKIRNSPVVVVGDEEKRHGVVLSKNYIAKAFGIGTGDTVWEAKIKAGGKLVCVGANFELYRQISQEVLEIYRNYSDYVESFGIDEAWIDVTPLCKNFKDAEFLANEIRKTVLKQIGITVSIGVSFNKVFAKLGSDLKKPNAIRVITQENFKDIIWPLSVEKLLYVGRATKEKLNKAGILTIGDLAKTEIAYLKKVFGKNGIMLYEFANGLENSPVRKFHEIEKSIGNSTTCPRDLKTDQEVLAIIYLLAENVIARLRKKGWWYSEVGISIRDATLNSFHRQKSLNYPSNIVNDLVFEAFKLFKENYNWHTTIRSVGVRVSKLSEKPMQLNFLVDEKMRNKQMVLEKTVEDIRKKYGYNILKRGIIAKDADFVTLDVVGGGHGIMCKF